MTSPESPAVQDMDWLREVAAEALVAFGPAAELMDLDEEDQREYLDQADAVLAAVLPEVADELRRRADRMPLSDPGIMRGVQHAATIVTWLAQTYAVSTPPTPPGSPLGAERATAVTEEAPSPQEPSGAVYRTGRKVGRTIYRDDVLIGVMDTPELAVLAVAAMNRAVPEGDDPWRRRIDVSALYGYELGAGDLAGVEAELVEARRERDEARAERNRLTETNARLEVERDDALALVAACTTKQQRRLAETIRRYEPVIEAAKARAQVIRDCDEFGSGSEGWYERDRASDHAIVATTATLGDIPSPTAPEAALSRLDGAMHSIWLHGNWRWLTKNMTTPEKEATLAAVLRHDRAMKADEADLGGELLTEADWAWWREPAPVEPEEPITEQPEVPDGEG